MVARGHSTDAAFEDQYPTWEDLIDRLLDIDLDEEVFGAKPLNGATFWITATPSGKHAEDGSEYQNYAFAPDEQ
jgi:hypothetical protein